MTKFGIDSLSPAAPQQARRIAQAGYTFCVVYVGGPFASGKNKDGWANDAVGSLAPFFTDGFIPIYVGQQNLPGNPHLSGGILTHDQGVKDGLEADAQTRACGFGATTPLGLDLEAGNFQADPEGVRNYLAGWVEAVNGAGHPAGLYSDAFTIAHLGTPDLVDWTFGASWHWTVPKWLSAFPNPADGASAADPAAPPPWTIWQFASGGALAGVPVDLNSAVDAFHMARYTPQR